MPNTSELTDETSSVMENLQNQLHAHRRGESKFHKRHLSSAYKQMPHTETQTLLNMMNEFSDVMHDIGMDLDADDPLAGLTEVETLEIAHEMHLAQEAKKAAVVSLTFGKGSLGLAFDLQNGSISTVVANGQAANLGVQPQWRVQTINNVELPFDREKLGQAMN